MADMDRFGDFVRSAVSPIDGIEGPSRDLWPLIVNRLQSPVRLSWIDVGLAASVARMAIAAAVPLVAVKEGKHATHPYLRAYMAGTVVPTLFLLVVITVFAYHRYYYEVPIQFVVGVPGRPLERMLVFPMAIVPNTWGCILRRDPARASRWESTARSCHSSSCRGAYSWHGRSMFSSSSGASPFRWFPSPWWPTISRGNTSWGSSTKRWALHDGPRSSHAHTGSLASHESRDRLCLALEAGEAIGREGERLGQDLRAERGVPMSDPGRPLPCSRPDWAVAALVLADLHSSTELIEEVQQYDDAVDRLPPWLAGHVRIQHHREALSVGREVVRVATTQEGQALL